MSTPQQVKIRQILFAEFRAKRSKEQARANIISKHGLDSISESIISDYYQRFRSRNYSLFESHQIKPIIQTLSDGNEVKVFKN